MKAWLERMGSRIWIGFAACIYLATINSLSWMFVVCFALFIVGNQLTKYLDTLKIAAEAELKKYIKDQDK